MKNIYILPTDKPSRLNLGVQSNSLVLLPITVNKTSLTNPQNIYITSDEEIKEKDYYLDKFGIIIKRRPVKNNRLMPCDGNWVKKIILTDNEDLIKDGVQAIDDEFLEWFVKNPSCEEVTVTNLYGDFNPIEYFYEIIIPKEEPKQGREKIEEDFLKCISNSKVVYKPKQETTLEEAGEKLYPNRESFLHRFQNIERKAFTEGAKWQMERSYSEEEVFILLAKMADTIFRAPKRFTNSREWFEKHKKK